MFADWEDGISQRIIDATKGLGITLGAFAVVMLAQIAFAADIVKLNGMADTIGTEAWIASSFRKFSVIYHAACGLLMLSYWTISAFVCRGRLLGISLANRLLSAAIAILTVHMLYMSFISIHSAKDMKIVCGVIGISDGDHPAGFDTSSSCDVFAQAVLGHLTFTAPVLLVIVSLTVRIVVSRRSARLDRSGTAAMPHVAVVRARP